MVLEGSQAAADSLLYTLSLVVRLLLESGADRNAKDQHGQPVLHESARGYLTVVKLLLENGQTLTFGIPMGRQCYKSGTE